MLVDLRANARRAAMVLLACFGVIALALGYWQVWRGGDLAQDPANPRVIVAGIASPPPSAEEDFDPGAEIHRCQSCGYTDIPQVTSRIPRRDMHAPAKGNCEVLEISADALPLS